MGSFYKAVDEFADKKSKKCFQERAQIIQVELPCADRKEFSNQKCRKDVVRQRVLAQIEHKFSGGVCRAECLEASSQR